MSESARIRPPWWLKYVNKVMIGLQKLGVGGDNGPVILVVPGRKTGKLRSTPITPMVVDGKRYVLGGLPGSDWAANARAAGEVELRLGRTTEQVRMVELPPAEAQTVAAVVPDRGADRCRVSEESRPGDGAQPRRVSKRSPDVAPCFDSTR